MGSGAFSWIAYDGVPAQVASARLQPELVRYRNTISDAGCQRDAVAAAFFKERSPYTYQLEGEAEGLHGKVCAGRSGDGEIHTCQAINMQELRRTSL